MCMENKNFTIGKVAKQTGVSIETIRFYEREGLIPEPPRRDSGYRQYTFPIIDRVRFIKRAKDLGFRLMEIKELLSLSIGPKTTCTDVKRKALEKMKEVDVKITDLRKIRNALKLLTDQCQGKGPVSECPILENLGSQRRKS